MIFKNSTSEAVPSEGKTPIFHRFDFLWFPIKANCSSMEIPQERWAIVVGTLTLSLRRVSAKAIGLILRPSSQHTDNTWWLRGHNLRRLFLVTNWIDLHKIRKTATSAEKTTAQFRAIGDSVKTWWVTKGAWWSFTSSWRLGSVSEISGLKVNKRSKVSPFSSDRRFLAVHGIANADDNALRALSPHGLRHRTSVYEEPPSLWPK